MWKQFRNSNYEISDNGEVRNIKTKRILKCWSHKGYLMTSLMLDKKSINFLVHRLVGEVFIKNFNHELPIHHINGIRDDNRLENLINITTEENNKDRLFVTKYFKTEIDLIIKVMELYNNNLTAEEIYCKIRKECI